MIVKELYDLLFDADRNGDDCDLDRIAFLLECMPGLQWLKEAIREDMPRLATLLDPPAAPQEMHRALLYCTDYLIHEGSTGSVASLLYHGRQRLVVSPGDLAALAAHRSERTGN